MTLTKPGNGHTMRVTLENEAVTLEPICHEPDGAVCRVECVAGCETYSYPEHEHQLQFVPYCNAVEYLSNSDVECCVDYTGSIPLRDGMPIEVIWDGDGYSWFPVYQVTDDTATSAPRRIYLAARYSRHGEMRGVRDVLTALGYEVTSRWIDQHGGKLETSYTPEKLNAEPDECAALGQHDIEDLAAADTVISFTTADGGGKGGRHVEHGLALGMGKRVIVCGPRENIFHTLPQIEHYSSWRSLVVALTPARLGGCA